MADTLESPEKNKQTKASLAFSFSFFFFFRRLLSDHAALASIRTLTGCKRRRVVNTTSNLTSKIPGVATS